MHRFIPEVGAPEAGLDPEQSAAVKRWARAALGLAEDTVVTVSETPCVDAGCPLVETVVTVFEAARTRCWAFTRPRAAVTQLMVRQTLAMPPKSEKRGDATPRSRASDSHS
jgi:hypothetical protein